MEFHTASPAAPSRSGLPPEAYDPIDAEICRPYVRPLLGTPVVTARSSAPYRVARRGPGLLRDGDGGA